MNKVLYTIMEADKFIPSNICRGMTENVTEAIRFKTLDDAKNFMKNTNKERNFKIVKVKCIIENI